MLIKSKEEFFEAVKPEHEDVEISDGLFIRLEEMGAPDFAKIWTDPAYQVEGKEGSIDLQKITTAMIVLSAKDASGARIFSDADTDGFEAKVGAGRFIKLSTAARRLNGLGAKEEKNSDASPEEGSSSGSLSS